LAPTVPVPERQLCGIPFVPNVANKSLGSTNHFVQHSPRSSPKEKSNHLHSSPRPSTSGKPQSFKLLLLRLFFKKNLPKIILLNTVSAHHH